MADYYSILKKTIESLPENTGAARRSVYSRARNAIVNQLKSYEPPLSPSEITAEQLRLEEAIRKVEAEAARATLGLSARKPTSGTGTAKAPEPQAEHAPEPKPEAPAEHEDQPATSAGAATTSSYGASAPADTTSYSEPEPRAPQRREPSMGSSSAASSASSAGGRKDPYLDDGDRSTKDNQSFAQQETYASSRYDDDENDTQTGDDYGSSEVSSPAPKAKKEKKRRASDAPKKEKRQRASDRLKSSSGKSSGMSLGLIGLLVLIVLGLAAVLYSQKGLVGDMMAGSDEPATPTLSTPDETAADTDVRTVDEPAAASDDGTTDTADLDADGGKIEDRLLDENGEPAVAADARSVTTQPIRPGDGASSSMDGDAGADLSVPEMPQDSGIDEEPAAAPAQATAPALAPVEEDQPVAGEQRAILYEEGDDNNGAGTASQGDVTWTLETDTDLEGKSQKVLTAEVKIPERNVTVTMHIKPNEDTSLPASHLVELKYDLPEGFSAGDVVNVPGLVMKPTEEARGDALIGASVKVSAGYFWIALSSIDSERDRNLALLRERAWIDIPMLYENGKRGILTLEKGSIGEEVVNEAIDSWENP